MNIKMTTNLQLSTESKKQKQTKQTTRIGTESQIWTSFEGLSAGSGKVKNGGKSIGINIIGQVQNRHGDIKNSIGNGEAKELICTTHRHELREVDHWREGEYQEEGDKGGKIGTTVIA